MLFPHLMAFRNISNQSAFSPFFILYYYSTHSFFFEEVYFIYKQFKVSNQVTAVKRNKSMGQ